jgi:outer membrane protein TolC
MHQNRAALLTLLVASAFLAAPSSGRAAGSADVGAAPPLRSITFSDAVAYARAHQPTLRAALAHVAAVRAQADVARSAWFPVVGVTAQLTLGTTNNSTASYLSAPYVNPVRVSATRAVSPSTATLVPRPSTLLGAGLNQEIFDFGRIATQAAAEDARADAERLSAEALRLVVDYDVEESYFALYAAKSVLAASEDALRRTAVHRDLAKAGVDNGLRPPIEQTRAEALLGHFELGRVRARGGVKSAQALFAVAVGVPEPTLDIAGDPPPPGELPSLQEALDRASAHNPEWQAALARVAAQETRTRAISAEARPNLYVVGSVTGAGGGALPSSGDAAPAMGLLPAVPNWSTTLVLSWPLFDRGISARADVSRADEAARREDARAVTQRLTATVQQALVNAETARDAVPVLRRSFDAAVANYAQADARFRGGLGNAVELSDAEGLRAEAEIALALGAFDYARARASLGRAMAEQVDLRRAP